MSTGAVQLRGWIPIRVYWQECQPMIDWCWIGARRFSEPFFDHTIEDALKLPFAALFRPQTPLEVLRERHSIEPGMEPSGFIVHMSRCGSTLVCQMLTSIAQNLVISEASSIDSVLRARFVDQSLTEQDRIDWFRWIVSALGQRRKGDEKHFFIKFDSWSAVDLPLIRRAFPSVPWVFLYRNPIEVLVSQLGQRGAHMVPGALQPEIFGLSRSEVCQMPPEEYCGRVLSSICVAVLEHHSKYPGLLINYKQLPEVVWTQMAQFCGVELSDLDLEVLSTSATIDSKNPGNKFEPDAKAKQSKATDAALTAVERWLAPVYDQLENTRINS